MIVLVGRETLTFGRGLGHRTRSDLGFLATFLLVRPCFCKAGKAVWQAKKCDSIAPGTVGVSGPEGFDRLAQRWLEAYHDRWHLPADDQTAPRISGLLKGRGGMSRLDRVSELALLLEQRILSGDLAAGEALPSERDLSASLGVSRSVVREALRRLASQGMVRSVHGSGTWVEPPSGRQISTGIQYLLQRSSIRLEDLAEVRLPLETTIAKQAALRRTEDHLQRLDATQVVLGDPNRPLAHHVQADLLFHAILAEATGNPIFGHVLAPIQELLIESRRRTLDKHGADLAFHHHAAILDAVRQGNASQAQNAMRFHIEANWRHLSQEQTPSPEPTRT